MKRPITAFARDEGGGNAAEFALILIPLVAFIFGLIHITLLMYAANRLSFATEATARCRVVGETSEYSGARCADDTTAQTYFNALYQGPTAPPSFAIVDDVNCGKKVTTSVDYTINAVVLSKTVTLNASACFPTT